MLSSCAMVMRWIYASRSPCVGGHRAMLCKTYTSRCFNIIIITVTLVTMTIIIIAIIIVRHTQLKLPLFLGLVNHSCGRNSTTYNVLHKRNVRSTHLSVTFVHRSIIIIGSILCIHRNIYRTEQPEVALPD